ncbi:hypothetical protein EN853_11695 [Mesorhizobium sp. M1C.F.Ca.ET.210.01.1.1]|uniref:hypothetical protein n=1 Tax=unclassified Mesorhizobium TaxID=325217 RepID=UPI000FD45D8D|nr:MULTISPECIES: hypothetical protein [unclassified Mesorhizobium]TGT01417.1 hypothetical protein EN820_30425 [bacterium M00.F.Ca.ET.177.01.1.1]RWA75683.1 MAG: hypothetical protein EOQ28_08550 [Mesorhizobium sp.]RWB99728.1 MAG: hypothetical protein EOQ57_18400 [Mesorhizobium sp.]RWG82848.1 MAG: hypothetical protein EOQ69_14995 [Mesorhizobium sp.]RWG88098.1 MAG: hypothetical protein EOQ70_12720 [Mesorhizobium sp.]
MQPPLGITLVYRVADAVLKLRQCVIAIPYNGQNSAASAGSIVLSIMAKTLCSAATVPIAKRGIEGKDGLRRTRA